MQRPRAPPPDWEYLEEFQGLTRAVLARCAGLKILVSAVRSRPCPLILFFYGEIVPAHQMRHFDMARRSDWIGSELRVLAWLLLTVGAIGIYFDLNDRTRLFSERGTYGGVLDHRFQKDNAVGATANAVEWIAKQTAPPLIGNAIWLGLALLAIGSLRRIRIGIERLADELSPLKDKQPAAEKPSMAQRAGEAVSKLFVPKVAIGAEEPPEELSTVLPGISVKKKKPPPPVPKP